MTSNNETIIKNTALLYIRMLLSIAVSLYTSRVVLQVLGVDDFGIYGLVGGVVSMFSFLNASMSGATSRFITFSLGKGNIMDTEDTFASALIIHIGIGLAIIVFAETVGLWFLENKLVIPVERMNAARIVYQFSILAMAVQVTQVPYNASIISYEKMDVYAYVELLNVALKLTIVYLLLIGNSDKLILYAVLVFAVNFIIACIYRLYCLRHFDTCRFKIIFRKDKLIPMLSFSGWDLYGNMCFSVRQQGLNVLINIFFGVAFNAASSVATSVQGVISSLSANVIQAFRPQIIKNYAQGEFTTMENLMTNSIKFSLLLFLMLGVPLSIEMKLIMKLWLGQVPEYAPEFCIVLLAISLFNLINSVLCTAIHASGRIKMLSMISGTLYLITIPLVYFAFKSFAHNALYAYIISFVMMVCVVVANVIIIKKQMRQLSIMPFIRSVTIAMVIAFLSAIPTFFVVIFLEESHSIIRLFTVFTVYIVTLLILTYFLGLDKNKRILVNSFINNVLNRVK